ncbi:hypothetical protein NC652_011732 [Populus alba x Populus x berolinensis]|nr:hypothetical protein NC652_011732 [Populus alba x Populus x berolinensis]
MASSCCSVSQVQCRPSPILKVRREKAEVEKRRNKEKRERKLEGKIKKKKHSHYRRHMQHRREDGNERSDYQARNEHEFQGIERTSLAEELLRYQTAYTTHLTAVRVPRGEGLKDAIIMVRSVVWIDIQLQERKDQELLFSKPVCSITAMDFRVQEKSKFSHSCTRDQFCSSQRESNSIKKLSFSTCSETTTTALELDRPGAELCHSCPQSEIVRDRKAAAYRIKLWRFSFELDPLPMKREHPEFENLEWLCETKPGRQPRSDYTEKSSVVHVNKFALVSKTPVYLYRSFLSSRCESSAFLLVNVFSRICITMII